MYNQLYIDSVGEKFFDRVLLGKSGYSFDLMNESFSEKQTYFAFQHYLVKCFEEKKNLEQSKDYIISMYNDFFKAPFEFVNSPLLKDEAINMFFASSKNNKTIKDYRNKYYSFDKFKELYKKKQHTLLSNDEKNQYFSYLIHVFESSNPKVQEVIKDEIKEIIDSGKTIHELNSMELQFYAQYVTNFALEKKNITATTMIGREQSSIRGLAGGNIILINHNNTGYSLPLLTKTIFHECRHLVQEQEAKGKSSQAAFEMAQKRLFSKYLDTDKYNSYHINYRYSSIELDAEKHGYFDAGVFLLMFDRNDLSRELSSHKTDNLSKRNYYSFMIDADNRPIPIDTFIVENMDNIIQNNPEELAKYPVLKHIYEPNGMKKSFSKIIFQKINETIEDRGILDNYINYGIHNNQLDTLHLENAGKNNVNQLFRSLSSVYRDKMLTLSDYYQDAEPLHANSRQIEKTTSYQIGLAQRILTYVNNNFDTMISCLDRRLDKQSYVYDFIYDLRDFDIKNIKNKQIVNNPNLVNKLDSLLQMHKNIMDKVNYHFAKERLDELSDQEKNRKIKLDNGDSITVANLITNYAVPAMDSHQNINIGNSSIYIGDYINSFKSSQQNNLQDMLTDYSSKENINSSKKGNMY